jgi:hypothetical protein
MKHMTYLAPTYGFRQWKRKSGVGMTMVCHTSYKTSWDQNNQNTLGVWWENGWDGRPVKRRGRCVVKGFTQKLGEHYWESFAAVVRYESVHMLLALSATKGLKICLIDVVGELLNAKPQGENFLEIPKDSKITTLSHQELTPYSRWNSISTAQWMAQTIGQDS